MYTATQPMGQPNPWTFSGVLGRNLLKPLKVVLYFYGIFPKTVSNPLVG